MKRRGGWLIAILAFMVLVLDVVIWETNGAAAGPNLVIFSICSLRSDRLGGLGGIAGLTPRMDAFARGGVAFARAYSQGMWTRPSNEALFTGRYPADVPPGERYHLPTGVPVLAELLQRAGYDTAGFTGGLNVAAEYGFNRGFAVYQDPNGDGGLRAHVAQALDWLSRDWSRRHPFFLFVQGYDLHPPEMYSRCPGPFPLDADARFVHATLLQHPGRFRFIVDGVVYTNAESLGHRPMSESAFKQALRAHPQRYGAIRLTEGMKRHLIAHYNQGVRDVDAIFGSFVAGLRARGLADDTTVVMLADHGWDLFEHGFFSNAVHGYDGIARVPILMAGPGLPRGRVVHGVAQTIDLLPTILEYLKLPADAQAQGQSLMAVIHGAREDRVALSLGPNRTHLRTRHWELVVPRASGSLELYDLTRDLGETRNLFGKPGYDAPTQRMLGIYNTEMGTLGNLVAPIEPWQISTAIRRQVSPALRQAMQQYGYW